MKRSIPECMSFRVCVYPDPDDKGSLVAHCLELDVMGTGTSVEESVGELLEVIEVQLQACMEHKAQVFFPAPADVWLKYQEAREKKRKIPAELIERIVSQANKRWMSKTMPLDFIVPSNDVPDQMLALA